MSIGILAGLLVTGHICLKNHQIETREAIGVVALGTAVGGLTGLILDLISTITL